MALAGMLAHIVSRQVSRVTSGAPPKPFRSPAPLGLHQQSAVQFDATMQVLHQVGGGVLPQFETSQSVTSVGRMSHSGNEFVRSYLSGGKCFVETVPDRQDRTKSVQSRLWVEIMDIVPATAAQWADLLRPDEGLVGWNAFQLDATAVRAAVIYGRAWAPGGAQWVPPVKVTENVAGLNGVSMPVEHEMMLYSRPLENGGGEYLLADVMKTEEAASLDVFIGVDILPSQMTVLASAVS